jgi:hypothetical protein
MKSLLALLVAVGLGINADASEPGTPKNPEERKEIAKLPDEKKAESSDDPLPAGSTLRFGTSRFRTGRAITDLAVSADGKIAVALSNAFRASRAFDLSSGRVLYGFDDDLIQALAISPDGRLIVTKPFGRPQANARRGGIVPELVIRDAATGRELRRITLPARKETNRGFRHCSKESG